MIGSFPLPADAILLEEELLDDFRKVVYDPERQLPILVITCPDLLDPTEAAQLLFGNAMIFWSDDPILFERIREILLPVTDSRWDSIQVLLPTQIQNAYHPLLSATDVTRMGCQQTMVSLWQAYCANFRAEDRRSFVTVDAIIEKRERRQAIALQESLNQALKDLANARGETEALNTKLESLQSAYDKLAQSSNQDDIAVLEGMITEISAEHDRLKQEIAALSTRLYACMGVGFSPSVEAEPCICELEHAIFVCFARLGGKGN